jgi:hypothetical protein
LCTSAKLHCVPQIIFRQGHENRFVSDLIWHGAYRLGLPCPNRITFRHTPAGEPPVAYHLGLPCPNRITFRHTTAGKPTVAYCLGLPCPNTEDYLPAYSCRRTYSSLPPGPTLSKQDYLPAFSCRLTHSTAWAYPVQTGLPSGIFLQANPQYSYPVQYRITFQHTPAGEPTVQPGPILSNTGLPSGILLQASPQYSLGISCPIQDYLPAYSCRQTHSTAWAYPV